jgi:hypothetical protein
VIVASIRFIRTSQARLGWIALGIAALGMGELLGSSHCAQARVGHTFALANRAEIVIEHRS